MEARQVSLRKRSEELAVADRSLFEIEIRLLLKPVSRKIFYG